MYVFMFELSSGTDKLKTSTELEFQFRGSPFCCDGFEDHVVAKYRFDQLTRIKKFIEIHWYEST